MKGFINVDKYYTEKDLKEKKGYFQTSTFTKKDKFVQADLIQLPFPENYADYILCLDCIEHIPLREVVPALQEIYRVLKPTCKLSMTTCDFTGAALEWIKMMMYGNFDIKAYMNQAEVIYGHQSAEGEYHISPMTPQFLNYALTGVGFKNVIINYHPKGGKPPRVAPSKRFVSKDAVLRNDVLVVEATK